MASHSTGFGRIELEAQARPLDFLLCTSLQHWQLPCRPTVTGAVRCQRGAVTKTYAISARRWSRLPLTSMISLCCCIICSARSVQFSSVQFRSVQLFICSVRHDRSTVQSVRVQHGESRTKPFFGASSCPQLPPFARRTKPVATLTPLCRKAPRPPDSPAPAHNRLFSLAPGP